ncbi:hypothetical protein V496_01466 [Pseudogymnoascus sp. VKM F-4515 (FW-2607)]|nr:hypothetical protein V496_01466 [Pseudogymnoascus sp. VKM F-4515 (FW-2607)]
MDPVLDPVIIMSQPPRSPMIPRDPDHPGSWPNHVPSLTKSQSTSGAEMTHEDAPEPPIVQPRILTDERSAVKKRRRDQAVDNRLSGDIKAPQELPGTGESAKTGQRKQLGHFIRQLYIVEDYTLDSVMKIMIDQHAFQAHKALYKVYPNKRGFKKNRMYGEPGSMSVTGLHQDPKVRPDDAARGPQKPSRGQPGYKW